jgi:hypothetical protein
MCWGILELRCLDTKSGNTKQSSGSMFPWGLPLEKATYDIFF